ncbi:AAA family ATPase [Pseudobutyrivibrio sp. LB2011]|uniref:AAA family ATPase n=1 Tax=Pseudobutyrivibrio sp. LB2011 TaxID=1408312 RepID=UPI0005D15F1E|nr:AAA family ATPase [Pseudobutyrivibrio sp. LB2011]
MLLKSMKLTNFRQFKETQSIEFSTDSEKNVTIIMGENGSGKTTLAQAFTWCLYGDTDFDDKVVLNKAVAREMGPNNEATVRVELAVLHADFDYTMIREQKYTTDSVGELKRPNNPVFKMAYKGKDGQQEFVRDNETELRMKEILPKELSRYFFFDGERIGNMSKEIRKGKSQEFAEAVKGLLGLSAFTAALDHLNGRSQNTVIKSYANQYDSKSDSTIAQYRAEIDKYDARIDAIEDRLSEIDDERVLAEEKAEEFEIKIQENKDSEKLAQERSRLNAKLNGLKTSKIKNTSGLIDVFNRRGASWMATKMINDALEELASAEKLDTGIPDIHARTIEYLIKRKTCICGAPIEFGNPAYVELNKVLDYIPPKSIGTLIGQFVRECEMKNRAAADTFDIMSTQYSELRNFDTDYADIVSDIETINKKLEGMLNVGELQKKYTFYNGEAKKLIREKENLIEEKGGLKTKRERYETQINELVLKDDNNKRIACFQAYATYMYQYLSQIYKEKETETREQLEKTVNEIFKNIYNGGFSLAIDEKYNIQIMVDDFEGYSGDVETSTAQSISVIFAFIAGVIKMARENNNEENSMLTTEAYPLVMDAPLSAFDKTRIQTVCDVLPKVAEQVIIFIKDTDGEIAEEHMGKKVGTRYKFEKHNEFETELVGR